MPSVPAPQTMAQMFSPACGRYAPVRSAATAAPALSSTPSSQLQRGGLQETVSRYCSSVVSPGTDLNPDDAGWKPPGLDTQQRRRPT